MAKEKRFEEIYSQGTLYTTKILVDKETGVQYIFYSEGYGGGLTVLLDRDGKPVLASPSDEK